MISTDDSTSRIRSRISCFAPSRSSRMARCKLPSNRSMRFDEYSLSMHIRIARFRHEKRREELSKEANVGKCCTTTLILLHVAVQWSNGAHQSRDGSQVCLRFYRDDLRRWPFVSSSPA